jgi:homoserine kinase
VGPVCLSGSGSTLFILETEQNSERIDQVRAIVTRETGCASTVVRNNRW